MTRSRAGTAGLRPSSKPPNSGGAKALRSVRLQAWRGGATASGVRAIPEEQAVALTYDGTAHAVMMASPQDLEDFAVGFSLTEGIVAAPDQIERLAVIETELGVELQMWLAGPRAAALADRRRYIAGPTGCGLCGIDFLGEALRPLPVLSGGPVITPEEVMTAVADLTPAQTLNRETHAVHAAGYWTREGGLVAIREDVGRHNAFDKLAGALARAAVPMDTGIVVLTSRLSVELVQKAAMTGVRILAAVSAPTSLAIVTADRAGITLAAIARADGFEVFTHPQRILAVENALAR